MCFEDLQAFGFGFFSRYRVSDCRILIALWFRIHHERIVDVYNLGLAPLPDTKH